MASAFGNMKRKFAERLSLKSTSINGSGSTGNWHVAHNNWIVAEEDKDGLEIQVQLAYDIISDDIRDEDLVVLRRFGGTTGGIVSQVKHVPTNMIMARKIFNIEGTPRMRKQIVRELKVLHDCHSDYLLAFYGAVEDDVMGQVVTCMEFMDAGSLRSISDTVGPLPMNVIGKIAVAVLGGLVYLYEKHRIVHRDLRPSNVLVNTFGKIKLRNLGMSSQLINSVSDTMIGTSLYLAPERIQGEVYTVRSDVWSLGLMLMELAVGEFPYPLKESDSATSYHDVTDILQQIVFESSPKLPKHEAFPQILNDFLDKCFIKNPKERPTPKALYESDAFVLAGKRTPVDLKGWAIDMKKRQNIPSGVTPTQTFDDERQIILEQSTTLSIEDKLSIDDFLARLKYLISDNTSEMSKKGEPSALCDLCRTLTEKDFGHVTSSATWRQLEDRARTLECLLCRLIYSSLPSASQLSPESKKSPPVQHLVSGNPNCVVLKAGHLRYAMDQIIRTGESLEDRDTASHSAFQMAAGWVDICLTQHAKCTAASRMIIPVLPTRVIDVGPPDGSEKPKLHLSQGQRALYFSLSYRWNQQNASSFQTTLANLESYRTEIPVEKLTQTMQDAIMVTRRFGIQYLWIDALCIIQDSADDWGTEAKEMARIYQNSLVTIAAAADTNDTRTDATDADETLGLFRPRSRLRTRPVATKRPTDSDSSPYVFADRRPTGDGTRPRGTLDARAWVLQEQILSPRVLSYSGRELYWDCLSVNASETFPDGIPTFYDAELNDVDLRLLKEAIIDTPREDRFDNRRFRFETSWKKVVEQYSERQMTKDTDKLVALSGVAKEAARYLEDEYILGLWKKRLWKDLLWWVKKSPDGSKPQRSQDFKAPTWSWASVKAPVSYELLGRDSELNLQQCLEIISVDVEKNQTLPVLHGKITVRGKLVDGNVLEGSDNSPPLDTSSSSSLISKKSTRLPRWKPDVEEVDITVAKCLIVAVSAHYVYALALLPIEGEQDHFTRVGIVSWRADPSAFGWVKKDGASSGWEDSQILTDATIF